MSMYIRRSMLAWQQGKVEELGAASAVRGIPEEVSKQLEEVEVHLVKLTIISGKCILL